MSEIPDLLREVFDRQIPIIGEEGQERLLKSKVAVVGLGGIGSPLSIYLAASGISLRLIDWDAVELSNLNRQVLYTSADVGRPKAFVAAERLKRLNPDVEVEAFYKPVTGWNALDAVRGVDLVLDAADNAALREAINEACVKEGLPHTYAAVDRWFGAYSFFAEPGVDPCLRCIFPEGLRDQPVRVVGPVPAIVAAISATDAIKFLSGVGGVLRGKLLMIDLLDMSFEEISLRRNPSCPVCAQRRFDRLAEERTPVFSRGDSHFFFDVQVGVLQSLRRAKQLGWKALEANTNYARFQVEGSALLIVYSGGGVLVKGVGLEKAREIVAQLESSEH